ncbi:MAG: molybdenum cofactor biosynthesis protein B [Phycisphaerae bacterium]
MPAPVHAGKTVDSVACGVLTVSDTRTPDTDTGGELIRNLLLSRGHRIHSYAIVKDQSEQVREMLESLRDDPVCAAVLLTGGTGLARRDTTYEAVVKLLDKQLHGFGELFRLKSYEQIGAAAMLSRAVAGVMVRTAVFSMPGSPAAVRLAMEELILPELGHIAYLLAEHDV